MATRKQPDPVDKHVGKLVRARRLMLEMSQEKLGDALGITFQQVQKYEKGVNRIGASRLQQIAKILEVSVSYFFEGAPDVEKQEGEGVFPEEVMRFLAEKDGSRIARAFLRIEDPEVRHKIVELLEAMAGKGKTE